MKSIMILLVRLHVLSNPATRPTNQPLRTIDTSCIVHVFCIAFFHSTINQPVLLTS